MRRNCVAKERTGPAPNRPLRNLAQAINMNRCGVSRRSRLFVQFSRYHWSRTGGLDGDGSTRWVNEVALSRYH
jgi:hypothetical protein